MDTLEKPDSNDLLKFKESLPEWKKTNYSNNGNCKIEENVLASLNKHFQFALPFPIKNYLSNGVEPLEIIKAGYWYELHLLKESSFLSGINSDFKRIVRAVKNANEITLYFEKDLLRKISVSAKGRKTIFDNINKNPEYDESNVYNPKYNYMNIRGINNLMFADPELNTLSGDTGYIFPSSHKLFQKIQTIILQGLNEISMEEWKIGERRNSLLKNLIISLYPLYLYLGETTNLDKDRICERIISLFGLEESFFTISDRMDYFIDTFKKNKSLLSEKNTF